MRIKYYSVLLTTVFHLFPCTLGDMEPNLAPTSVETCATGELFGISYTNVTYVSYSNTQSDDEYFVAFDTYHPPSTSVCRDDFQRCRNVVAIQNGGIYVFAFPLREGIGLVSFSYNEISHLYTYQEKFVVQYHANCVFSNIFNIGQRSGVVICLNFSTNINHVRYFVLRINFGNLNLSQLNPSSFYRNYNLFDPFHLSNFIFYPDKERLLTGEYGHIYFADDGYLVDVNLDPGNPNLPEELFLGQSCENFNVELMRVSSRTLAAYCNRTTIFIDLSALTILQTFSEGQDGINYMCSENRYISINNDTLTLRSIEDRTQIGSPVLFPFNDIIQGYCNPIDGIVHFVATLGNRQVAYCNLDTSTCEILYKGEHPVKVNIDGHHTLVGDDSQTILYNLTCVSDPIFIWLNHSLDIATIRTTTNTAPCQCTIPTINMDSSVHVGTSVLSSIISSSAILTSLVLSSAIQPTHTPVSINLMVTANVGDDVLSLTSSVVQSTFAINPSVSPTSLYGPTSTSSEMTPPPTIPNIDQSVSTTVESLAIGLSAFSVLIIVLLVLVLFLISVRKRYRSKVKRNSTEQRSQSNTNGTIPLLVRYTGGEQPTKVQSRLSTSTLTNDASSQSDSYTEANVFSLNKQSTESSTLNDRSSEPPTLNERSSEPPTLNERSSEPPTLNKRSSEPPTLNERSLEPPTIKQSDKDKEPAFQKIEDQLMYPIAIAKEQVLIPESQFELPTDNRPNVEKPAFQEIEETVHNLLQHSPNAEEPKDKYSYPKDKDKYSDPNSNELIPKFQKATPTPLHESHLHNTVDIADSTIYHNHTPPSSLRLLPQVDQSELQSTTPSTTPSRSSNHEQRTAHLPLNSPTVVPQPSDDPEVTPFVCTDDHNGASGLTSQTLVGGMSLLQLINHQTLDNNNKQRRNM